ncbi:MAG: VanZ family protein [Lachnospiraceae bacterium]|nr:VanZ family protein [Lachnospiraceae bacterium]
MKKLKYIRVLLIVLILMWMGVIFGFSSKNGTQSSKSSGRVTKTVISVCYPAYSALSENQQIILFQKVNFFIRKAAHFMEYFILAVLVTFLIITFDKKGFSAIICAVVICAAFAASDEIHQGFVSGRSPSVKDVILDTSGAASASCLIIIIYKIRHKSGGNYDIR